MSHLSEQVTVLRGQGLSIPEISQRTSLPESSVQKILVKAMRSKTETPIQAQIKTELERLGYWVIRTQVKGSTGARSVATGEVGMPDLWLPGLGNIEVKKPGEDPTPEQLAWHARARSVGICVGVAESVAEAVELAREFERAKKGECEDGK